MLITPSFPDIPVDHMHSDPKSIIILSYFPAFYGFLSTTPRKISPVIHRQNDGAVIF